MPAKNPNTEPATPVIISMLWSCQAMNEIVIATTVPHTMERKTWGLIFESRTFIT